jgi:hypothetical protein
MENGVKWILIIVAVFLGWKLLGGVLAQTVSYSTGTAWGGGLVPGGRGTWNPYNGVVAPKVYQPVFVGPDWWRGLSAGYDPNNGLSFGFNTYGGY